MKIFLKRFVILLVIFVTPAVCRGPWETGLSISNFRKFILEEANTNVRRVARSPSERYAQFSVPQELRNVSEASHIPSPERRVETLARHPGEVTKDPMRNIDSEKSIDFSNKSDAILYTLSQARGVGSLAEQPQEDAKLTMRNADSEKPIDSLETLDEILPKPPQYISRGRGQYRTPYGHNRNRVELKRMPELVEDNGYPLETHTIETKDGYGLTVHRVRKKNFVKRNSRVALLWHGLMGSSADFFVSGPDYALGYLLADNDFDVWLANQRGNFYSRDSPAREFWNFSIHEVGKYDVPACIDYVIKATGVQKIFAISHSTGAAAFLIALNERGIYQSKLHGLVSMAPCTTIQYTPSKLMQLLMRTYGLLKSEILENFIGKDELKSSRILLDSLVNSFCDGAEPFCDNILFMLTGYPKRSLSAPPELINYNTPSGTSVKMLIHLAQMSLAGEFQAFDYGEDINQDIYGHTWPNDYIIDKLMTRVIFFSSRDDEFVSDQDISVLSKHISRLQVKIKVKTPNFGHSDFLYSSEARESVYERLIQEVYTLV